MKILLVADIHYTLPQLDWLTAEAVHYDALILAGDLLDVSAIASLDAQIVVMRAYLERLSALTSLVVCSGNHGPFGPHGGGEHVAGGSARCGDHRMCRTAEAFSIEHTLISRMPLVVRPRGCGRDRPPNSPATPRARRPNRTCALDLGLFMPAGRPVGQLRAACATTAIRSPTPG